MAVNLTIVDKRLITKKYRIEDFIFEGMSYGVADDSFRLIEQKIGNVTIVFSTEKLARGIELSAEKKKIHLRMSLPTGENEIVFFYEYAKKICELFHTTTFEREGEIAPFSKIPDFIECDIKASKRALEQMQTDLHNGIYTSLSLYAVYNPVTISAEDLPEFVKDLKKLENFLEEKQKIKAYYGDAKTYQKPDGTIFGVYPITEDVLTILPFDGSLIVNETKVNNVYVSFVYDDKMHGIIKYKDFLSNMNKDNLYDSGHFLIKLTKDEMKKLLEKYEIEM